jgi:hypothetical protein
MPRGVRKAVEPEVKEPKATKAVEPEAFDVIDSNGNIKRTFAVDIHGDQAEELAVSFAKKFGLKVK